jgi:hypothetical protein
MWMRKQHPDNITKLTKIVRLLTVLIQLVWTLLSNHRS